MVIKRIFMVVFAVIIASIPLTSVVGAAGKFDSMSLPDQIKAYILYNSVDECFSGINDFRAADATGTVWSSPGSGTNVNVGRYLDSGDEKWECKTIVSNLLPMLGHATIGDMLQSWKYVLNSNGVWHHDDANLGPDRGKALRDNLFGGQTPALSAEHWYEIASTLFSKACSPKNGIKYADANASQKAAVDAGSATLKKVNVVTGTPPEVVEMIYEITPIRNAVASGKGATKTTQSYGPSLGTYVSCSDLVDKMNANAAAYKSYVTSHSSSGYSGGGLAGAEGGTEAGEKGKSTCNVDGIGWVVCPVMNFLGGLMDKMVAYLGDTFLKTDAKLVEATDSNGTYAAWKIFRNYANIAFIIAFLFVIYSQITGAGASNYGLKRMLPRLIVSAILVNVSFIICQLAVDISNALGYGVTGLFNSVIQQVGGASPNLAGTDTGTAWADAIGGAGGVLIAGIGVALALALGILIPALIAVLIVVLILLARQALIVLLIVAAPLAFVAYLLPNTEEWFKKWYKMFFNLLMVFPIIAGVFGASKLAATIIDSIGSSQDPDGGTSSLRLMALGITVIPFFIVPGLLKGAMAASGALGAKLQGMGDKATGRVGAKAGGKAKERWGNTAIARGMNSRKALKQQYKDRRFAEKLGGSGVGGFMTRRMARGATPLTRAFSKSAQAQYAGLDRSAYGAARDADMKDVNYAAQKLSDDAIKSGVNPTQHLRTQLDAAIKSKDTVKARAAVQALKGQGEGGVAAIRKTLSSNAGTMGEPMSQALRGFIGNEHSDLKDKDARLTAWASSGVATDLEKSNLSGLSDKQIASQTEDALEDATVQRTLDDGTKARIRKAADEGNIDLKQGKRSKFF